MGMTWPVIPANAQLTPWPDTVPTWDSLTPEEKKMYARQAEVYAGYMAYTDYEIGRVIKAIEDMGKLDNTLTFYIGGDNGASPEGTTFGTPNEFASFNSIALSLILAASLSAGSGSGSGRPRGDQMGAPSGTGRVLRREEMQ